jgi:hypothetical protein
MESAHLILLRASILLTVSLSDTARHGTARHGTISRHGERHGRSINTCRHRAKSCQMNRAKSCRLVVPNRAALQITQFLLAKGASNV